MDVWKRLGSWFGQERGESKVEDPLYNLVACEFKDVLAGRPLRPDQVVRKMVKAKLYRKSVARRWLERLVADGVIQLDASGQLRWKDSV